MNTLRTSSLGFDFTGSYKKRMYINTCFKPLVMAIAD